MKGLNIGENFGANLEGELLCGCDLDGAEK